MNEVPPKIIDDSRQRAVLSSRKVFFLLFLFALGLLGLFLVSPFWTAYRADTGFKKAKNTIDPELLLEWEQKVILKYPITNQTGGMLLIPQTEIPGKLVELYSWAPPRAVVFKNYGDTLPFVRVSWHDWFLQWGFSIGGTNALETNYFGYWTDRVYYFRYKSK